MNDHLFEQMGSQLVKSCDTTKDRKKTRGRRSGSGNPENIKKPQGCGNLLYMHTLSDLSAIGSYIFTSVITDGIANIFTHLISQVRLAREWWFLRDSNPRPTD